jgi:hypothetical protein
VGGSAARPRRGRAGETVLHISPETEWALEATVESLVEGWQARGLVEADPRGGLRLTASGAWFAGNLIAELTGQGPQQVCQA